MFETRHEHIELQYGIYSPVSSDIAARPFRTRMPIRKSLCFEAKMGPRHQGSAVLVYIIDDDAAVARTLARIVGREGWDVSTFPSADAFLAEMDGLPFGCIISDIRMPGTTGLQLIDILHSRCPDWPVIMMTGYADVTAAVRAFRSGAIHFLEKPFKKPAVVTALREAAERAARARPQSRTAGTPAPLSSLTQRETEILESVSRGLQSKTIAWDLGISTRTVEMHRSNILLKLGARNTSEAVAFLKSGELGGGRACASEPARSAS